MTTLSLLALSLLPAADAYPRPDLKDRIAATIEAYRARYPQKSVGVLTRWECGAF